MVGDLQRYEQLLVRLKEKQRDFEMVDARLAAWKAVFYLEQAPRVVPKKPLEKKEAVVGGPKCMSVV